MKKVHAASFAIFALAAIARAQAPVFSDEFQVNTYTTGNQYGATAANLGPSGSFVVTWNDETGADGDGYGVRGRMFDVTGSPLGGEFTVTEFGTNDQGIARVGSNANGDFVVTWTDIGTLPGGGYQVYARRFNSTGVPQGGNISVNTYTTDTQAVSSVALDSTGNFVVVWRSIGQDGADFGVFGQLFNNTGAKVGAEFQVNQQTTGAQRDVRVARRPTGEFMVVWRSPQDDQGGAIMARRYQANGTPVAGEFQVNTRELGYQYQPDAAYFSNGDAIVVWTSYGQDGSNAGVYGQRLDASGAKLGPEFNVNTYTPGFQGRPSVAVGPDGDFAVIWQSAGQDGSDLAIRAQQFDPTGKRLGVELPVNNFTTGLQGAPHVTAQPNGQYVAVWDSPTDGDDKQHRGAARRLPAKWARSRSMRPWASPTAAPITTASSRPVKPRSCSPSFTNNSTDPLPLTGTASNLRGLPGPTYALPDASADYGTIAAGRDERLLRSRRRLLRGQITGTRPAQHWDALFDETLSYEGFTRTAALHLGGSFPDVPRPTPSIPFIENLFHNGVTGGCAGGGYCPANNVTRAQMAVFLLKARWGSLLHSGAGDRDGVPRRAGEQPLRALDRRARPRGHHGGLRQRPLLPRTIPSRASRWRSSFSRPSKARPTCRPRASVIFQDVTPCPGPTATSSKSSTTGASPAGARQPRFSTARKTRCFASRWPSFS